LLEVEAILAASTFIFPYKIHVKIPGILYSTRPGDDSTFFLRESGLSSGTQKAPIAEGRGLLEVEVLPVPGMKYCV
jgi:hypothetical protein